MSESSQVSYFSNFHFVDVFHQQNLSLAGQQSKVRTLLLLVAPLFTKCQLKTEVERKRSRHI